MDDQEKINTVLAELKSYEPIFHHPEIFGTSKQDILAQMAGDFYEVGWRLRSEYWGKGYATEGAKASLDYGFKK